MGITDKKQPYLVGVMLKPQHNVIADNVLQISEVKKIKTKKYVDTKNFERTCKISNHWRIFISLIWC
jgi:hypothetical protein